MARYLIVAPLLAGLFHGLTWFAGPIICMLILSSFFSLTWLTPVVAIFGVLLNSFLILLHKKVVKRSVIRPLLIPSLLWIPFWYLLLQWVDQSLAKKIIGVAIIIFLGIQYLLSKQQKKFPDWFSDLLAWLSWLFWFAYNVNWPQLAAWMITKKVDKETSILISTTYFLLFGICFVGTHFITLAYTQINNWSTVIIMVSIMLLWARWWDYLRRNIWEHQFHTLLYFFLTMTALLFLF